MSLLFLFAICYAVYLLFVIITILITIVRKEKQCRNYFSEGIILFSEAVYTIIGPIIGFWRFDEYLPDIPFAKQHILTIIILVIVSSISFWLARFTTKISNLIIKIILSVGMLQGIVLCLFTTIHFITFIPLGMIYPFFGFELLSPFIAMLFLIREFYFYNKTKITLTEQLPLRNELGFIPIQNKIFQLSFFNRLIVYGVMLIPLIITQVLIAYGCGQDIDALVKAYTHSHGFIFSIND